MRSCSDWITPSRMCRSSAPSPSTRASAGTSILISRRSVMRPRLLPSATDLVELGHRVVDVEEAPRHLGGREAAPHEAPRQRCAIHILRRAVAGVAIAAEARAQRAAARARHGPHARRAMRNQHADMVAAFAFEADLVVLLDRRHAE